MTSTSSTATGGDELRPKPIPSQQENAFVFSSRDRDPYIAKCPEWHDERRSVVTHEEDRKQIGLYFFVPVRSLPTYRSLRRTASRRSRSMMCASVWSSLICTGPRQSGSRCPARTGGDALLLAPEEAQQIADSLIALVKESQR